MEEPSVGDKEKKNKGTFVDFKALKIPKDNEEIDGEAFFLQDKELQECLLNLPPLSTMENPINIINIVNHQARDLALRKCLLHDDKYSHKEIQNFDVAVFTAANSNE